MSGFDCKFLEVASTASFLRWHSLKPKGFDCKFLEVASTVSFLRWHSLKPKGFDCKFLEVASTVSFLLLPLGLWPMPTPTTLDIFLEDRLP